MEINRENYAESLENIKASDKFLAETKELMLKESAKSKTASRPVIMKITPFAAAAACIAVIAAFSVNILKDKSVSTIQIKNSPSVETAAATEEEYSEAAEEIADEAVPEEEETTAETTENAPVAYAVTGDTTSADETTESVSDETSAETESNDKNTPAEGSSAAGDHDDTESSSEVSEDSGSESQEGTSEDDDSSEYIDDSDDDTETDDGDDDIESDAPVAPAFTSISGGRALHYPDFSPTDTDKLIEFLSLAAQDEINAEITLEGQNSYDIFGEKALALNEAFAKAADKLVPIGTENFTPTISFSVFDNLSGDLLYTVQTDGSTVSICIRNGETFCFSADNSTVKTILSAAE